MTRATEGFGPACRIGQRTYRGGTVVAGNTGGTPLELVDGHGEGRAQHAGVVLHLKIQFEFLAALKGYGCTEHATPAAQHKVDGFRRDKLGGHDEIAFVFTVLVVDYYHEFALAEVPEGFLYGG